MELAQIPFVTNVTCLYPTDIRGEAYLAAGQGKSAAREFRRILEHSGLVSNCWTGALAKLGVTRANALQAKTLQGADADAARPVGHKIELEFSIVNYRQLDGESSRPLRRASDFVPHGRKAIEG